MNQYILIINGPICAGKTSVVNAIMKKSSKLFHMSQNKIKWLISDYTPDRDRNAVQESVLLIGKRMLEEGMSLVLEGGSVTQGEMNAELEKIAKTQGLSVSYVNIEAPLEILKARFDERVRDSAENGTNVSVKDEEGFMKRYNAYLAIKGDNPVIDSGNASPEEIAEQVMKLVQ